MGWEVHVAAEGQAALDEVSAVHNFPFCKREVSFQNLRTVFRLAGLLRRERFDVVCSNATLAGMMVRAAVVLAGRPRPYLVHSSHGYLFRPDGGVKARLYLRLEQWTSKLVNCVITMNQEDDDIALRYRLSGKIVHTDGMGLEPEKFPLLPDQALVRLRKEFRIPEDGFIFLCVGEFSKRKNQREVLQAFAAIFSDYPQARLLFAGDGAERSLCEALAVQWGVGDRVSFLGQVSNMNGLYRCSHVLVTASRSEGLPFNVMEALLCGVPVLASRVKGHVDLLQGREAGGLLFDKGEELSRRMAWMLENPDGYRMLRDRARLPEKYELSRVKPGLLACYLAGGGKAWNGEENEKVSVENQRRPV